MTKRNLLWVGALLAVAPLWGQTASPDEIAKEAPDFRLQGLNTSAYQVLSKATPRELGFYPDHVLIKVRRKWYRLIPRNPQSTTSGTTVIEFIINRDGSLGTIQNAGSSGDSVLDAAARDAITAAAPFHALPVDYHKKSLDLRYRFGYNQEPSDDRPLCGQPRGGVYAIGEGVAAPHPVYQPDPAYSEEGRRGKYQGLVLIRGTVETDGTFSDLCIQQALGAGLDEQAVAAVKNWKFEPATKDGQAVPVRISVETGFHLY